MKERYIREILAAFPYPIVAFFSKLRTDECFDPGPLRLKYILSTGETIARFLGTVTLCECRDYLERHPDSPPPPHLTADFSARFSRPAWGTWMHFTREGLRWLSEADAEITMPEMAGLYFKKGGGEAEPAAALGKLLTIRNGLNHEKIQAFRPSDYRELCEETCAHLESVLEAMEFLLNYELVFINQIEVNKKRKAPPLFLHRLSMLMGSSDAFPGDRKQMNEFMDSRSIFLLNVEARKHLNLTPLLVYESAAGKAPDIFFFNGFDKPDAVEYSACNHGGGFVSGNSDQAGDIALEIGNILSLFSAKPMGGETHG
ncbi:MAG: hypothetical protein Q8O92_11600 [Candidatus Latescibacter sp.]|nr:hypothetical protein [Candidatus Latescibacter sp.]